MSRYSYLTTPTYADIQIACQRIVTKIQLDDCPVDCVMGLVRGGLIPATIISHMLNVPMVTAAYSSFKGEGEKRYHENLLPVLPFYFGNILIIDDICDSGNTLAEVSWHYRNEATITAALYYKERFSVPPRMNFKPDYYAFSIDEDAPYIKFPWEI